MKTFMIEYIGRNGLTLEIFKASSSVEAVRKLFKLYPKFKLIKISMLLGST